MPTTWVVNNLGNTAAPGVSIVTFAPNAFTFLEQIRYSNNHVAKYVMTDGETEMPTTMDIKVMPQVISKKGSPSEKILFREVLFGFTVVKTDGAGVETLKPNGLKVAINFSTEAGSGISDDDVIVALGNALGMCLTPGFVQKLLHGVPAALG